MPPRYGKFDETQCLKPITQLGSNLRQQRREKDLSQYAASELAGVSRGVMAQLEAGRRIPNLRTLGKLALAYETSIATLLKGVDPGEVL